VSLRDVSMRWGAHHFGVNPDTIGGNLLPSSVGIGQGQTRITSN